MDDIREIKNEIERIKKRNARVEADKAWETSLSRKILIAALTYVVVVVFFWFARLPKPFVNAMIPTAGFLLSTLTIPFFKRIWVKYFLKK